MKKLTVVILKACVIIAVSQSPTHAATLAGPITNAENGHIYYLLSQNTWTASESEAVQIGGHLATVRNLSENDWIYSQFSQFGGTSRGLWIGLNEVGHEGTWVWTSGEPVSFYNWGSGEPAEQGLDYYVNLFWPGDPRQSQWNDMWDVDNLDGIPINGVVEVIPPPPPSPTLNPPAISGGIFSVNWTSVVGVTYQLQCKDDLLQTNWMNLGDPVSATNGTVTISDSMTNSQRFYRVTLVQ